MSKVKTPRISRQNLPPVDQSVTEETPVQVESTSTDVTAPTPRRATSEIVREALYPKDADEIFNILAQSKYTLVEQKTIEVDGKTLVFNIKLQSYSKCAYVDAKQYRRGPGGQLIHDVAYAETVGIAHQLFEAVVKNLNEGKTGEDGKPLPPDWVRFFTIEQLLGKSGEDGIMDDESPHTKELIYKLIRAVWEVVPEWNVMAKGAALEAASAAVADKAVKKNSGAKS